MIGLKHAVGGCAVGIMILLRYGNFGNYPISKNIFTIVIIIALCGLAAWGILG